MITAIKAALAAYKKTRHENRRRKQLLRLTLDYMLLRDMLNAMADHPTKLYFEITLPTGERIKIAREQQAEQILKDPFCEMMSAMEKAGVVR